MAKTTRNAALLVRISDDRAGDAAGVGRQEADARALAERLGWTVGEVFVENDTSAFKRRMVTLPDGSTAMRVLRPEFRRLLDSLSLGQYDALIAYHLDRVARDPRDLEDLIDVVERQRIPVETVTGSLRMASDADITMARIGVAIANQSSRDASRRIRRKHEELAGQGTYAGGGARRYGYEPDGMTVRESEARVLRWAAKQVLEGATVSSIVRELDRRGELTVFAHDAPGRIAKLAESKNPKDHERAEALRRRLTAHKGWSTKTLHDQLRSPRIAGLRVHRGEIVGPAAWPAILDRETWDAVVATLHSRASSKSRPQLKRWLNGLLFCGLCGHPLTGNSSVNGDKFRYWCNTHRADGCGKIAIDGAGVEAEVERITLEYLARPEVVSDLRSASSQSGAEHARRDLEDDTDQLRQLSKMWADKQITLPEFAAAREVIQARIDGARAASLAHVPAAVRKVFTGADQEKEWRRLDPQARRDLVRLVLESSGYKGWVVAPADRTAPRRFDPSRLTLLTDHEGGNQ